MTDNSIRRLGSLIQQNTLAPCVLATTENITLSGLQEIDCVPLVEGDRVLVTEQDDMTQNGVYIARLTQWDRARDFNQSSDIVNGTVIIVTGGKTNQGIHQVFFTGDFNVGTSIVEVTSPQDSQANLVTLTRSDYTTRDFSLDDDGALYNIIETDGSLTHITRQGGTLSGGLTVSAEVFQLLTAAQQETARRNIGAIADGELDGISEQIDTLTLQVSSAVAGRENIADFAALNALIASPTPPADGTWYELADTGDIYEIVAGAAVLRGQNLNGEIISRLNDIEADTSTILTAIGDFLVNSTTQFPGDLEITSGASTSNLIWTVDNTMFAAIDPVTGRGLLTDGRVPEIVFKGPFAGIVSGSELTVQIRRPNADLLATSQGDPTDFELIAEIKVNMFALSGGASSYADDVVFDFRDVIVEDGDIVFQGSNSVDFPYLTRAGIGAHPFDGYIAYQTSLSSSQTVTASSATSFQRVVSYDITYQGDTLKTEGPQSIVVRNSQGNIEGLDGVATADYDGLNILNIGTSIETATGGGPVPTQVGWTRRLEAAIGGNWDHQAVGSSLVGYPNGGGGGDGFGLSGTIAELTADFGASNAQFSYENKIIGTIKNVMLYSHGINDRNRLQAGVYSLGDKNSVDKNTFWGASRVVFDAAYTDDPDMLGIYATMPHRWASYNGSGFPNEHAQAEAFHEAQLELAEIYGMQVIDFYGQGIISRPRVANQGFLADSIHPSQAGHDAMAEFAEMRMREIRSLITA